MEKKYAPRIFVVPLDEEGSNKAAQGVYFASLSIWNTGWRKTKPKEYLSLEEHEAIVQPLVEALETLSTYCICEVSIDKSCNKPHECLAGKALENYKKQTGEEK